ncbi:flippase [Devosia sp. CAU 1758]
MTGAPSKEPRFLTVWLEQLPSHIVSSQLAKSFAGTFAAGIAARLAVLFMTIVLARNLSPSGYGEFIFAIGTAALVAQIAVLGWPSLMLRIIPTYRAKGEYSLLRGVLRSADMVALTGGLVAVGAVITIASLLSSDVELVAGLMLASLMVIPAGFNFLRRAQLAGSKRAGMGVLLDEGLPPLAVLAAALAFGIGGPSDAVLIYVGAMCIGVVLASIYFHRTLPNETWTAPPAFEIRGWMLTALPLLVGLSSKLMMNRMDVLMLGPLAGLTEVGYYGVAFRVTYLLTFPQIMIMTTVTPFLAESIANKNARSMWRYFGIALAASLLITGPVCIFLIVFAEQIIEFIFGQQFAQSAAPLGILALAQSFTAISLPISGLLIASGRGMHFGVINAAAALMNVGLNFLFIPHMGGQGAAWATTIASGVVLLAQTSFLLIHRKRLIEV